MSARKFDPAHLARLNDPEREKVLDPDALWTGFGVTQPLTVIDVGAGTGFFSVRFASRLARGGTLYACDVSLEMVDWMEKNLPAEARGAVTPLLVQENAISVTDSSADLAYMINVFHELEDPPLMLSELFRLLAPGGRLAVVDWKREPMIHGPPLERRVDGRTVRSAISEAGFHSVRELDVLQFHHFHIGDK
jgi:ubiquinone/menaquinone biosynthesis C-methylase UbiE